MNFFRARTGFTLIELMISLAIMSILATALFPMLKLEQRRRNEEELHQALITIRHALDAYKQASDEGHILSPQTDSGYPPNLAVLVDGVTDAKRADGKKIYFLRKLPHDPFSDNQQHGETETWGLRSYNSSADNPQPGNDVYDIYSLSVQTGLNGVPYREW